MPSNRLEMWAEEGGAKPITGNDKNSRSHEYSRENIIGTESDDTNTVEREHVNLSPFPSLAPAGA